MKRLQASKHHSNRIIHVSILAPKNARLKERKKTLTDGRSITIRNNKSKTQSSNITYISNRLPNYENQSIKDTWANPTDYTKRSKENSNKKKKIILQRNIIIAVVVSLLTITIFIVPLIMLLPKSKSKTHTLSSVLRWNTTGITRAGVTLTPGTASNQLNTPRGVYIDWSNTLYIADYANHRIQKYLKDGSFGETAAGNSTGISGNASAFLNYPFDVTVDSNGNVYVADTSNSRVQLWNCGGSTGTTITGITGMAGYAPHKLNSPFGIVYDVFKNGIFVADTGNQRVMYYRINNINGTIIGGNHTGGTSTTQLNSPTGIYFDEVSNSVIIANRDANNVVQWIPGAPNWTLIAGSLNGTAGNTPNTLNLPYDVTVDPMGNVYVADSANHRVQFFPVDESNGKTIGGTTNVIGSNASLLYYPSSIALDSQLNLYVSDRANHRVQKFMRY